MSNATEKDGSPRPAGGPGPFPAGMTAADLMTPNPVSIRDSATFEEAVAFLTDTGYSAAPVIDETGRAVGVISRTDIVVYDRERVGAPPPVPDYFGGADPGVAAPGCGWPPAVLSGPARVRDLMTPAVFAVAPDAPAGEVARRMADLNVHRLFVADQDGVLVGVVTALDLLRRFAG